MAWNLDYGRMFRYSRVHKSVIIEKEVYCEKKNWF